MATDKREDFTVTWLNSRRAGRGQGGALTSGSGRRTRPPASVCCWKHCTLLETTQEGAGPIGYSSCAARAMLGEALFLRGRKALGEIFKRLIDAR